VSVKVQTKMGRAKSPPPRYGMWRQVSNLPGECEGAEKDGTG